MTTKSKSGSGTRGTRGGKAKSKAHARGGNDKGVAREIMKNLRARGRADMEAMLDKMELRSLSENVLPFSIIDQVAVTPTWDDDHGEHDLLRHEWTKAFCDIARAALRRGYRLLVPVWPDEAVFATCEIVKALGIAVHVWYSRRRQSLLVGMMEEDQIQDEEAGDAAKVV